MIGFRHPASPRDGQWARICFLGGSSSSSGSSKTTTTTNPWSGQSPYLTQAFKGAQNLYENYVPQYYPGQQVAPFTNAQQQALTGIANQAATGEPITQSSMNFATNLQNGDYINNNPGNALQMPFATGQMLDTSNNPYTQQLTDAISSSVTPQIQSQFVNGNSMSNPAAAYATSQGVASALANPLFSEYQQGLQQQQDAAQNIASNYNQGVSTAAQSLYASPTIQQMPYNDYSTLFNAGSTIQNQQQQGINAAENEWAYNQGLPYQTLDQFLSAVGGGSWGGTSQTTTPYYSNPSANLLGGALGGSMLGGSLLGGSSGSGGSSYGSAIGAGLGALMSFL